MANRVILPMYGTKLSKPINEEWLFGMLYLLSGYFCLRAVAFTPSHVEAEKTLLKKNPNEHSQWALRMDFGS